MAMRGDPPLVIMQRCGHRDFKTTQIYIREAEAIGGGASVGVCFPPLPFCLLEPVKTGTEEPDSGNSPAPEGAEQAPVEAPDGVER
jgi:hypothetical protein